MAKFNLGKLTEKAKDFVDKNGDKIASSVDKVTDKVDQKTKGKYHDKLQKVDNLTAKLDKKGAAADGDAVQGAAAEGGAADVAAAEVGADAGPEGLLTSPTIQTPATPAVDEPATADGKPDEPAAPQAFPEPS